MTGDLPLFAHSLKHTFDLKGRARRTEVILYIFLSQIAAMMLSALAGLILDDEAAAWTRFAIQWLAILPLLALSVRRLHDFGYSGYWTVLLLMVAGRNMGLDLAARVGGWEARAMIERPLSYVDWLLFLPFAWLYIALLIVPGKKGANRYGPDPRDEWPTSGSGGAGKSDGNDRPEGLGTDAHAHMG